MKKRMVEVEDITAADICEIGEYLDDHNMFATDGEIVGAAIRLAKRLGSDKWSFVCELKGR